ncbi:putative testis specific protein [Schistosoma mansoni]|nr:putative testis specific protein [Schistosoma mansoni]|eukprot:XP_018650131.1 putative testis specific protein [Schistosoma mansoni]
MTMQRCGISINSESLVLIYERGLKTRKRRIRLSMPQNSSVIETYKALLADDRHKQFINLIPKTQLLRLLTIFKDLCNGMNISDSLNRRKEVDTNNVDYSALEGNKTAMNNLSGRNEMLPTKQDFTSDEEIDLPEEQIETYSWDSDECEF